LEKEGILGGQIGFNIIEKFKRKVLEKRGAESFYSLMLYPFKGQLKLRR
jgi:hypothetical protein